MSDELDMNNKQENISRNNSHDRPYKFGFVLNTTIGNMTRYLNLRKYAERDQEIEFTWAPVSHYTPPDMPSLLRILPEPLFMRARVLQQAMPVIGRLGNFDAVMIHMFEVDIICALRSYLFKKPLRVSSTDEAPIVNRNTYPIYPADLGKPVWRQKLRLAIDLWRVKRTDLFIPFSNWCADILTQYCGAEQERVCSINVGLDLELWKPISKPKRKRGEKVRILFVGGDFVRKGGPLLLEVFRGHFQGIAELHLVTRQAPNDLPPDVYVHSDFQPNDQKLTELYASVDMLVVPTTADIGPVWAFLEAMAMSLPVVATDTGSNSELVRHAETGFVIKIGDGKALAVAMQALISDPDLRYKLGERGRRVVEEKYNASINVPLILRAMKDAVDVSRPGGSTSRTSRS